MSWASAFNLALRIAESSCAQVCVTMMHLGPVVVGSAGDLPGSGKRADDGPDLVIACPLIGTVTDSLTGDVSIMKACTPMWSS